MTRSKLEFAKILAATMKPNAPAEELKADAEKFAAEMTLRKLCHEIEKAEETAKPVEPPPKVPEKPKGFWAFLTLEDSDDE
jgi:hypothetical protein